jgi:hypothetical protein
MNRKQCGRSARGLFMVAVLLGGCGGSGLCPVEGKVLWQDGSPATELAGSQVMFEHAAANTSAQGTIQPDATFRMTTNAPNDGVLAGEHRILIVEVGRRPVEGADGEAGTTLEPGKLDPKFADPSASNLTATIKPGTNQVTLTVDRNNEGAVP